MTRHHIRQFAPALSLITVACLLAPCAWAASATLEDRNTEIGIDTGRLDTVFFWEVDGHDHLVERTYFFRTGDMTEELRINNIDLDQTDFEIGVNDRHLFVELKENGDPDPNEHSLFTVTLNYELIGGSAGTGVSELVERIKITNTQPDDSLSFTLFEYDDFDLVDTSDNDVVTIDVSGATALDTTVDTTLTITPSIPATAVDVAAFGDILDLLQDSELTNLSLTSDMFGPGEDIELAFQWDFNLDVGESIELVKTTSIVPEPGALLTWLSLAACGLGGRRNRRQPISSSFP